MEYLSLSFNILSGLLAFLATALLLWVNQNQKHSNRLLAWALLFLCLQNVMQFLFLSKFLYYVPWLLRFFAPTNFLIGPITYLYIRSTLNKELKFNPYDWILLLPAIATIINFIPFYILSNEAKIVYINNHFYSKKWHQDTGEGFLPTNLYYALRILWSAIFVTKSFVAIHRFKQKSTAELLHKNKILIQWLFRFNMLLTLLLLSIVVKIFLPALQNTSITLADIIWGITLFYIGIMLFIRPQILYGIYQPSKVSLKTINKEIGNTSNNQESAVQSEYKRKIALFFETEKPFLQTNYSLTQLVIDIHIPRHLLSAYINQEYGMGFREFLNHNRIKYLLENINKPEWQQFTLEAIAAESGFSSRTTFIKNFKAVTGKTPSTFLKENRIHLYN